MNRQHQRSLSSASIDNRAFREAISKMRNDVLESKAETQRFRDQLNCLILLVKRAWTGDEAAAIHVSKIVGVPPPSVVTKIDQEKEIDQSQNAAVHRWAMLSIGLLNRHYRQLEGDGLALAKVRLQLRQEYLDQQLQSHRELLDRERLSLKKRIKSAPARSTTSTSGTSRDGQRASTEKVSHPGTLVEFLYPGRTIDQQKLNKRAKQSTVARRYSQPGLFDSKGMVDKPKRPVSAIHQKTTDAQRSRPKSAVKNVTIKGDRPLKYETTRPISARLDSTTFLTNPPADQHNSTANNAYGTAISKKKFRAQSARTYIGINKDAIIHRDNPHHHHHQQQHRHYHYRHQNSPDEEEWEGDVHGDRQTTPLDNPHHHHHHHHDDEDGEDMGHFSPFQDGVSEELRHMEQMEHDFRRTAAMLQQKLGISGKGAV